jgi:hypothetical protein
MAKAVLLGFAVALGVGVIWGFLPNWGFYLSLVLGFGVAEAIAWAAGQKRGLDLQIAGWVAVVVGVLVSRAVLASRLDYTWDEINAMNRFVEARMHLQVFPDGLIALIPLVIVFVRFR